MLEEVLMKRKEFIFVYALIVLLVVLLTIDVKLQTKIEILVTSEMVLFSVDFQSIPAPENKIDKMYLFFYTRHKNQHSTIYNIVLHLLKYPICRFLSKGYKF